MMQQIVNFFTNLFSSASSEASDINTLFLRYMILAGFIVLLVSWLVIFNVIKYRAKNDENPKQIFGNKKLELTWTILPFLAVSFFFFLAVKTMDDINKPLQKGSEPDIVITAHQWWWDMRYPKYNVVTANELHIPVGKNLLASIKSADVIHDWWVPSLGRKMDAVPGRTNYTWIEADKPGVYNGTCSEYCGAEHAWMRIRVVAESQAEFEKWIEAQQKMPGPPKDSLAMEGAKLFQSKTCADCHSISGTPADASVGPNLSHFESRKTMLSGMEIINDQNLKSWLTDPQKVKSGARMPDFLLSKNEVNELAAYIEGLK
ncbi:MAG: cytochrome c oxidase subunit II [Ignavibacteriaceae bacterium]